MRRSYYLYRRWLPLVGLVFVVAAPSLPAVPLPSGDTVLSGTTVAARPELAGVVEEDLLIPYSFQGAGFSVSGVIQNRVVRSVDGTLDFYWRIISDASSTGEITAFRVGGFGGFALDGDFRLDGVGSVGPDTARNFGGGFVNFLFSNGVSAGESSFFFFLDTQATAFSNTGSSDLLCAPDNCISPSFTDLRSRPASAVSTSTASTSASAARSADLALSLTDTPDLLTVNGQLTYTITVRNNGPGTATGVQVVDSLPPGATVFGPASSSQGACERYGDGGLRSRDPCRRCSGHRDDKRYSHGDRKSKQCRDGGRVRDRSGPREQQQYRDDDGRAIGPGHGRFGYHRGRRCRPDGKRPAVYLYTHRQERRSRHGHGRAAHE